MVIKYGWGGLGWGGRLCGLGSAWLGWVGLGWGGLGSASDNLRAMNLLEILHTMENVDCSCSEGSKSNKIFLCRHWEVFLIGISILPP